MKKLLYILFAFSLAAASSCTREEVESPAATEGSEQKIPIILSLGEPVTLSARTKSTVGMEMGFNPAIKTIHVAVFGSSGYLQEYVSATPCDATGRPISGFATENATTSYFLVRLSLRTKATNVHIVANGPSSLSYNAYENALMLGLRSTDGNGAYWSRLSLPDGIRAKMFTNPNGEQEYMTDSHGDLIPTDATVAAFSGIVLVRNFAGITVRERTDVSGGVENFDLIGFTVCNMASEGSIAMYSQRHDGWITEYENKCILTDDPDGDGFHSDTGYISWEGKTYRGYPLSPVIKGDDIPRTEAEFNAGGAAVGAGETKFIYERAVTPGTAPFVLLAARYVREGKPTSSTPIQYYRLDITKNDNYVPFYRNINYYITITSVSVSGYDTPEEAAKHNSGDNFSISVDTSTLPDVSNGVVRMFVQTTTMDLLYTPDEQSAWFQFLTIGDNPQYLNEYVDVSLEDGGNAINLGSTTYSDNRGHIAFTLNEPTGQEVRTSVVKLLGEYNDGLASTKISRTLTVRVFNKQDMSLKVYPATVAPIAGAETTLTLTVPKNLSWSMFPMDFTIEDSAKSLNPITDGIPVRTNTNSIIPGHTSEPSYQFVYTLNWSDYSELLVRAERAGDTGPTVSFDIDMKTIKDDNATTVYVANPYFNTQSVVLYNDSANMMTPSSQTISGTTATVQITSSGPWTLSITRSNGAAASGASLSEYSGAGAVTAKDITVTLPENNGGDIINYTVAMTNTALDVTRRSVIHQKGPNVELSYYNNTRTVPAAGSNSFYVNVDSEVDYTLTVVDEDGDVLGSPVSGTASGSTVRKTLSIPANDQISDRGLNVVLSNATESIVRSLHLTQYASTAELSVTTPELFASQTSATVLVTSSIPTILNVYDSSYSLISSTDVAAAAGGRNVTLTLPANGTAVDRTFRVELCNESGDVLRVSSITQFGPTLYLRTDDSEISASTRTATVNVYADMGWSLSVSGGSGTATLSTLSGNATSLSGTNVTLNMPENTDTENKAVYTVTGISSDGTKVSSVTVTQGYAVAETTLQTRSSTGSVSGGTYTASSDNISVSISGAGSATNYITVDDGGSITVSVPSGYRIESIVINRTSTRRQASYSGSDGTFTRGSVNNGTTTNDTWTANSGANVNSVTFSVDNTSYVGTRSFYCRSLAVTYVKI